jgi:hypothetical protein
MNYNLMVYTTLKHYYKLERDMLLLKRIRSSTATVKGKGRLRRVVPLSLFARVHCFVLRLHMTFFRSTVSLSVWVHVYAHWCFVALHSSFRMPLSTYFKGGVSKKITFSQVI